LNKIVKFTKRLSKLTPELFVETLIIGCLSNSEISLEGLCKLIKRRGVRITKQGLHQRFTPEATELMKHSFQEAQQQFKTSHQAVIDLLKPFSNVYMADSSGIALPSTLKDIFKGTGGTASEAGLKIQVLYEYLQGQINQVALTEGCRNDQSFDDHLNQIQSNSLHLQDLGYFKLSSFRAIHNKGAYFISRYLHPTAVFNEIGERLSLVNELRDVEECFMKQIKLGKNKNLTVRLIAFRLPDTEVEKRIRTLKRNAQKRGNTPTKETLELAKWSIYITNVPETLLTAKQVYLVYTLRWQIELFFKLCKSEAGINKVSGKKVNRILCEIYAKLTCIVFLLYLCFPFRWENNQEISFIKAYKALRIRALDLFKAIQSRYRLLAFLKELFDDFKDFTLKDKYRKKRRLTYQRLMDSTGQKVLAG
jgi:hypothetical protein